MCFFYDTKEYDDFIMCANYILFLVSKLRDKRSKKPFIIVYNIALGFLLYFIYGVCHTYQAQYNKYIKSNE